MGLLFPKTDVDREARLPQTLGPLPGHLRERIGHGGHDPAHARSNNRFRTRRGFALMAAGLKRHIESGIAPQVARLAQGIDLRMSLAKTFMPSFAHHTVFSNNDCSDQRIRLDVAAALLGQAERAGHPSFVATIHAFTLPQGTTKHTKHTKKKERTFE